tara:strand:+ start:2038 stop:2700 length:663 start_codon:yes stop_codon:yes gene_type:complete
MSKAWGYGDIRTIGSGNIGATNVLRTGNKKLAFLTLLLDATKGAIFILLIIFFLGHSFFPSLFLSNAESTLIAEKATGNMISVINPDHHNLISVYKTEYIALLLLTGLAAIIGHCYPVWLKFKGGKGVATTLGVLLAAVPFTGLIACATWLVSAKFGKISSVAAMSAMIVAPVMTYVFYGMYPAIINALISALVIWRHRSNIARIRAGTEPRIGDKKKDS